LQYEVVVVVDAECSPMGGIAVSIVARTIFAFVDMSGLLKAVEATPWRGGGHVPSPASRRF